MSPLSCLGSKCHSVSRSLTYVSRIKVRFQPAVNVQDVMSSNEFSLFFFFSVQIQHRTYHLLWRYKPLATVQCTCGHFLATFPLLDYLQTKTHNHSTRCQDRWLPTIILKPRLAWNSAADRKQKPKHTDMAEPSRPVDTARLPAPERTIIKCSVKILAQL